MAAEDPLRATTPLPPVSAIADVLALWHLDGWLTPPLRVVVGAGRPCLGRARTVTMQHGTGKPAMTPVYELLGAGLDDEFLVIATGDVRGAVWGEILTTAALGSGAAGVLVDGSVRDQPALAELALPTYAADQCVVGPNGTAQVTAIDDDVSIESAIVRAGDLIVADATGCVRIAATDGADVLDAASRYCAAEQLVVDALHAGEPMATAYLHKKSIVDELRR